MGAYEFYVYRTHIKVNAGYQPVVVSLDVEYIQVISDSID